MTQVPYLSVIGWMRNDSYMHGYVDRLRRAMRLIVDQLNRHKVPSEIVLCDWNPPADRPLMADAIGNVGSGGYVTVRFIIVDGRHHQHLIGSQYKGMHVLNAANVALRRARGRFMVPKPMDTFFTEGVIAHIATGKLREDEVYRCDRYDVDLQDEDLQKLSDRELFELMASRIVLHHDRIVQSPEWGMRDLHTNACGDFSLMAASRWHQIRGYQDDPTVLCLDADSIALHAAAAHGVKEVCLPDDCRVYKIVHQNTHAHRIIEEWKDWQRQLDRFVTNHFSPDMRIRIRMLLDYPRRRVRGVDGMVGPSIERNFVMKARRYARNDTSFVTNAEDWGLARETLVERITTRAAWDTAPPG